MCMFRITCVCRQILDKIFISSRHKFMPSRPLLISPIHRVNSSSCQVISLSRRVISSCRLYYLQVPKLTLSEINMLTWHNQKWIIIVNLSTSIFMIAFNSTNSYLIVYYVHTKIILLYMRNISFIFIIIYFIVIYFAAWLGKHPLAFSRILYLQRCEFYEQVTQDQCQLADPQVQWVGLGWTSRRISFISKVIFSSLATQFNKRSPIFFCYSNPMISTVTVPSSSTNHHHWTITSAPVTPEADLVAALDVATTLSLLKPVCCLVLSAILNRAASQAPVTGPNFAIPKAAITCDFWTKCLSTQTVPCGLQKCRVTGVITTCDLELSAFDPPKGSRDHVSVNWRISCCSSSILSVIPPFSTVFHPVFAVTIGESSNQPPAWVTVALKWEENETNILIKERTLKTVH